MKLTGTIRRADLEEGHWVLHTDRGDQYQLTGSIEGVKDGMRAEVEGEVDKQAMGFGMVGHHFAVQKLKANGALAITGHDGATGQLREIYERMRDRPLPPTYRPRHGGAPGIVTAHSLDPLLIPRVFACSTTLNGAGPLAWAEREFVNLLTSRLNQCFY